MAGVILYVENTLISYSEVQAVQNYETHAMSGYIFHMFIWNKILWDGCKKIRNNAEYEIYTRRLKYPNMAVLSDSKYRPG